MKFVRDVVIVAYGRSPVTKLNKGALSTVEPSLLGAEVMRGVLKKIPQLPLDMIDDVIVGCAYPEEYQGYNLGRVVAKRAGLPDSVPGQTVNRFCSGGLQSIAHGANAIMSHQADVIVAGGIECASWCPMTVVDLSSLDPFLFKKKPFIYTPMGLTAEIVAEKSKEILGVEFDREEMDQFAVNSHKKAAKAQKNGEFKKEIIPVTAVDKKGNLFVVSEDDGIRTDISVESLSNLAPAFKDGGVCTAGNSSPMNDGAAFVVLMSRKKAKELGIKPLAQFLGFDVGGCHPAVMGIGPLFAIPKLLKRLVLRRPFVLPFNKVHYANKKFDVVELNEAFTAQAIPCMKKVGFEPERVNPRGGATALGHPLGATGTVLTCRALSYLEDTNKKTALVSMCIGGGMGAAGAFKRLK
jgi:acetyl-CoA acyltransferase